MSSQHLNPDEFEGIDLYHGTAQNWAEIHPSTSHANPLHVARKTDIPGDYAFDFAAAGWSPEEDWEGMNASAIKHYRLRPGARVHVTETEHRDGVLPEEEQAHVEATKADVTLFGRGSGALGLVYNRDAVEHVRDIKWKEGRGIDPLDEMEWRWGENWRDELY